MKFIIYNGDTGKCSFHDEKNNETFRGGGKYGPSEIVYSFEEQARKSCWLDFDYFQAIAFKEFKENFSNMSLCEEDLQSLVDVNNEVYTLLNDLELQDDYDWIASEYQEKLVDFLRECSEN